MAVLDDSPIPHHLPVLGRGPPGGLSRAWRAACWSPGCPLQDDGLFGRTAVSPNQAELWALAGWPHLEWDFH